MDNDNVAVKASNLTKSFGSVVAVDGISFNVNKGEIFGFLGPNGAGKTTTVRMLTGILTPDKGNIIIEDIDLGKNPIQAKMSMIPEIGNVYVDLTAKQNLSLAGRYYGLSKNIIEKKRKNFLQTLAFMNEEMTRAERFRRG